MRKSLILSGAFWHCRAEFQAVYGHRRRMKERAGFQTKRKSSGGYRSSWTSLLRLRAARPSWPSGAQPSAGLQGQSTKRVQSDGTCDAMQPDHSCTFTHPVLGTAAGHPGCGRYILVAESRVIEMQSHGGSRSKVSSGAFPFRSHPVSLLCCSCVESESRTKHLWAEDEKGNRCWPPLFHLLTRMFGRRRERAGECGSVDQRGVSENPLPAWNTLFCLGSNSERSCDLNAIH